MRWIGVLMALILLSSISASTLAAKKHGDPRRGTVQGTLVDSKCYLGMKATGGGHQQCAVDCLKGGTPGAILDSKGNLTVIILAPETLAEYANKPIRVTGQIFGMGKGQLVVPENNRVEVDGKAVEVKSMM